MHFATPLSRRAFTLSPLIILLFVLLVAICAYRAWMIFDRLNASGATGARVTGMKFGAVAVPLVVLAIAGGIGALAYFLARKSENAANAAIGLVLMLSALAFGYSTYNIATAPPPPVAPKQLSLADQMRANTEKVRQGMDAQRDALQRQSEAARDAAQRQAEAMRNAMNNRPTPGQPSAPPPPPPPTSNPAHATPRPAPATPAPKPDDPSIKLTLDPLADEVSKDITDLAAKLSPLLGSLTRPPKQDIRDIRKRIEDIAAVREPTAALAKRLRDLSSEAEKRLAAANLSTSSAHAFAAEFRAMPRAFAAESLVRTLDAANEEATYLRDTIGKWSIGRDGKVDSKDFSIKSRANSLRFSLEATLGRKDQLLDELKGR